MKFYWPTAVFILQSVVDGGFYGIHLHEVFNRQLLISPTHAKDPSSLIRMLLVISSQTRVFLSV